MAAGFLLRNGYVFLDYYSSMADANGAMLPGLSSDGVHPTAKGYAVMAPLAEHAIAQALVTELGLGLGRRLWEREFFEAILVAREALFSQREIC